MQVTIIPIVIGAFGTVTKGLIKGLEDLEVGERVEKIQKPFSLVESLCFPSMDCLFDSVKN